MNGSKRLLALAVAAACSAPLSVFATNGMNLEGYGPIATGMGGASMAYDNGTAAMMNNPATLGLMDAGNRLDLAVGVLGPNVDASAMGTNWPSKSDSFMMPAVGWAKKDGQLTFGMGAFAQGGMGTEYKATAPGAAFTFAPSSMMGGDLSMTSSIAGNVAGWEEMSEVGVMRILFPLSYNVDDQLTVGGSLDYVRASMDIKMAMTGGMMMNMMTPGQQTIGTLGGSMISAMGGMMGPGGIQALYGGHFDFADSNPFTGETSADGFALKLGFTYKVSPQLSIGGSYHSETSLGDLSGDATVQMAINMGGTDMIMPINGDIKVKDFQWPQTIALGLAYQPTEQVMIAADVKHIAWSDVMKSFNLSFTAADTAFAGTVMDAELYQNWDDQTVFQVGVSYAATKELTLRAGVNVADNPIPDATVHYLFPATIENHYTVGLGYQVSDAGSVNFSLTHAPEVDVTNGLGMETTHSQTSWQLMYSHRF